jgi:hypothetical protein
MRCLSCDGVLSDYECSRKSIFSGEYIQMCSICFKDIKGDCLAIGNTSLMEEDETHTEDYEDDLNDLSDYDDYWSER